MCNDNQYLSTPLLRLAEGKRKKKHNNNTNQHTRELISAQNM